MAEHMSDPKDIFKLTAKEKREVRKACKAAFPNRPDMVTAMFARPNDAMRLVSDVRLKASRQSHNQGT